MLKYFRGKYVFLDGRVAKPKKNKSQATPKQLTATSGGNTSGSSPSPEESKDNGRLKKMLVPSLFGLLAVVGVGFGFYMDMDRYFFSSPAVVEGGVTIAENLRDSHTLFESQPSKTYPKATTPQRTNRVRNTASRESKAQSPQVQRVPSQRSSRPWATDPTGPFFHHEPVPDPESEGEVASEALAQGGPSVAGKAATLVKKLLSRPNLAGTSQVDKKLIWSDGYRRVRIQADFQPHNVSQPDADGVRTVIAELIALYETNDEPAGKAPFYDVKNQTVYRFRYGTKRTDAPLKMPIYFIGNRFRDVDLEPHWWNVPQRTIQRDGEFNSLMLRDAEIRVGFRETGINANPLTNIEVRLIDDPRDIVSFATLICDGRCDDHWPTVVAGRDLTPEQIAAKAGEDTTGEVSVASPAEQASELPPPEQIELRFERGNRPIWTASDVDTAVEHSYLPGCLRTLGIEVFTGIYSDGTGRTFAGAERFDESCQQSWIDYRPDQALVTIDLDREDLLRPRSDDSDYKKAADEIKSSSMVTLRIKLQDTGGTDLVSPDGTLMMTYESNLTFGHDFWLVSTIMQQWLDDADIDTTPAPAFWPFFPFTRNVSDSIIEIQLPPSLVDYKVGLYPDILGYEQTPIILDVPLGEMIVEKPLQLTKARVVGDLRASLVFDLLGEQTNANALMLEENCRYSLTITPPGDDTALANIPLTVQIRPETTQRWLVPDRDDVNQPVQPESRIRLTVEPGGRRTDCPTPADEDGLLLSEGLETLDFKVRHPQPWLLLIATSAEFPNLRTDNKQEQLRQRDVFWIGTLDTIVKARKRSDSTDFNWLFAQMVEGSGAGKGELILGGPTTVQEAQADHPKDLLPSPTQFDHLVLTPATSDKSLSSLGGGTLDEEIWESAVKTFAEKNYRTLPNRYHTVLWIQGDGRLEAESSCQIFQALAESLATLDIRLLGFRPVRRISESDLLPDPSSPSDKEASSSGSSPTPAVDVSEDVANSEPPLRPYSDNPEHNGIFVCDPSRFGGPLESKLLVFVVERGSLRGESERNSLKALIDALLDFRRDRNTE